MRIFVVDDDPGITDLLQRALRKQGHDVTAFNAPGEALDALRKGVPDILVSDVRMPGMTGLDLMAAALALHPGLSVIIMTADHDFDVAVRAMNGGATYFLPKARLEADLDAALARCLRDTAALASRAAARRKRSATAVHDAEPQAATIGQYQIIRKIGEGAVGTVFLCQKRGEPAQYAVKLLKDHHLKAREKEPSIRRFVNEGNALSQLTHPNVIKFYEFGFRGEDDSRVPYIVMEYFKSDTLTKFLDTPDALDLKAKLSLIRQIASGLDAVHAKNIHHRDVKPDNILVDDALHAKITDFGVCHLPTSDLTMTNQLIGTPSYIPPENIRDGRGGKLMDIYALGVISYELFLGVRPYQATNFHDLVAKILHEHPIEPRAINPDFPSELQDILAKMMRKNPRLRYQSAREIVEDLDRFERDGIATGLFDKIRKLVLFSKDWR